MPDVVMTFKGRPYNLTEEPMIIGILNHTPDSFYAGSRIEGERNIHQRIEEIIDQGGKMIDVGGYSSRPDAAEVSEEEEWRRVKEVLDILKKEYPELPVSVDTFTASVARKSIEEGGADVINDVSGGRIDPLMLQTVAELQVPYVLMHMRGTPKTMQSLCEYKGRVADGVIEELLVTIEKLRELGLRKKNIILDPGFGFSKTTEQNYELMSDLDKFRVLDYPLYVGISRKSMIYRYFGTTPAEALNGTTVLNTYALLHGAHFIRVHDVREAWEAMKMVQEIKRLS